MTILSIFLISFVILVGVVFGYINFENEFRCSYCGKYKLSSDSWHRRGPYLHPENIVNECNSCHSDKSAEERRNKRWAKIEEKSSGASSWTEYTDHDGNTFMMMNMITSPGFSGTHMFTDESEIKSECKHEIVSTEYLSQPYGHCVECNRTVFRDEDNNWKL